VIFIPTEHLGLATAPSSRGKLVAARDAAFQANRVKKANQADPESPANLVTRVTQVSLEHHLRKFASNLNHHRATLAHQAQQVHQADRVNQATPDHQAHQAIQAKMVNQASQALKDHQAAMVNQETMVHQEMQEHQRFPHHQFQETKVQMETQEAPAHQVLLAHLEKTVNQAVPVPKDHQAQPDRPEKMAKLDQRVPKVRKVHQEKKVSVQNIAPWTEEYFSKMEPVVNLFKNSYLGIMKNVYY